MIRQTAQSNPYGTQKITSAEFRLTESAAGTNSFKYELNLIKKKYTANHQIKIFFEKGNYKESLSLGTVLDHEQQGVGKLNIPPGFVPAVELTIVDTETRIFSAKSAKIKFLVDQDVDSLLPVKGVDLGEQLWEIEIDHETGPLLKFNFRADLDFKSRLRSDWAVRGSVAPAALRIILQDLPNHRGQSWAENWYKWITNMGLEDEHVMEDPIEVDAVLERYAKSYGKFANKLATQNSNGG
jgi:hypothetical protein